MTDPSTYRRYRKNSPWRAFLLKLAQFREKLALRVWGRPDPASTIVVAGSGRSGTTWLSNLIAAAPGMQAIFEPLHPHLPQARRLPLPLYLRPDQEDEGVHAFFQAVLAGRVRNWWTDYERQHLFAWRWVVKLIRANLMLGWLDQHFACPIVLIVRHPCAVVNSRLSRGWLTPTDRLLRHPSLLEDHLAPYVSLIRSAQGDLEKHAVLWAVETLVAWRQLEGRDWIVLSYERLRARPWEGVQTLYQRLGLAFNAGVERRLARHIDLGSRAYLRWQEELSGADQERILRIVRGFGIDLYDGSLYPRGDLENGLWA